MRLLAYLLIAVCLTTGALAAATAYIVEIDGVDDADLEKVVLSAPAGAYTFPTEDERERMTADFPELPDLPVRSISRELARAIAGEVENPRLTAEQGATLAARYRERLGAAAGEFADALDSLVFAARVRAEHDAQDAAKAEAQAAPLVDREPPPLPPLEPLPVVDKEPTAQSRLVERERVLPIGRPDDTLTPGLLALLRENGVERVKAKAFVWSRWPHLIAFTLSCVGLLLGASLVRADMRRRVAAHADGRRSAVESPDLALTNIAEGLARLVADLEAMATDEERLGAIVETVGDMQRLHVQAILDARVALVGRMGLGGYAEFMDRFAAMERKINRAWSAAADKALPEAIESLELAHDLAPGVQEKLSG